MTELPKRDINWGFELLLYCQTSCFSDFSYKMARIQKLPRGEATLAHEAALRHGIKCPLLEQE
jgi:hypothetical protein